MTQSPKKPKKGFEKTCSLCGEEFICRNPANYQYTLTINGRKRFYCSYHCWSHVKEQIPKKPYRRMMP